MKKDNEYPDYLDRLAANSFNSVECVGNKFGFVFEIGENFRSFCNELVVRVVAGPGQIFVTLHSTGMTGFETRVELMLSKIKEFVARE